MTLKQTQKVATLLAMAQFAMLNPSFKKSGEQKNPEKAFLLIDKALAVIEKSIEI